MHDGSSVEGSFCPSFSVFHLLSFFVSLLQTSEKQNTIRLFQCVSRQIVLVGGGAGWCVCVLCVRAVLKHSGTHHCNWLAI